MFGYFAHFFLVHVEYTEKYSRSYTAQTNIAQRKKPATDCMSMTGNIKFICDQAFSISDKAELQ